jgi:hypothetical protein
VGRTALIVAVEEAEIAVSELRLRYDPSASLGVPAHVTVLFPFQYDVEVDDEELAACSAGSTLSTSSSTGSNGSNGAPSGCTLSHRSRSGI